LVYVGCLLNNKDYVMERIKEFEDIKDLLVYFIICNHCKTTIISLSCMGYYFCFYKYIWYGIDCEKKGGDGTSSFSFVVLFFRLW
jgi:hypothetical protein